MKMLTVGSFLLLPLLSACAPRAPYAEAELAYARGDYIRAEGIFADYARNTGTRRIEAQYYYGMCLARLGDLDEAEKTLARATRFCEERALRARIIAGRAEVARLRGQAEQAETLLADLRAHYADVIAPETLTSPARGVHALDPLVENNSADNVAVALHRVRLATTYRTKAEALAVAYRLNAVGIETLIVSLPQKLFTVQLGAFRNPRLAAAQVEQAAVHGVTAVVIDN